MGKKLVKQIGKFGVVGIINTLVDMTILNFLFLILSFKATINILGLDFLLANIISVTIAMIGSFILNKYWTFAARGKNRNILEETLKFILITIVGMFFIHQIVFNFFAIWWVAPTNLAKNIVHLIGIYKLDNFITLNFAKILAILSSMTWNFIGYKFIVFQK